MLMTCSLLTVTEGPKIIKHIEPATITEGQDADFTCQISGMPRPSITWWDNIQIQKFRFDLMD